MSWLPWRKREAEPAEGPSRQEVSAARWGSLKGVAAAVRKCSLATGVELAVARREVAGVLRESMSRLLDLAHGAAPDSRVHQMARRTADEMLAMSQPWLIIDFLVTDRSWSTDPEFTGEEAAELQRTVWERAEEVIAEARDDEPATARETLRQLIDEVAVFSSALMTAPMPEPQATEWRLAAEEIAGLAAAALARAGSTTGGE
jgi:hypothetical protein